MTHFNIGDIVWWFRYETWNYMLNPDKTALNICSGVVINNSWENGLQIEENDSHFTFSSGGKTIFSSKEEAFTAMYAHLKEIENESF